MKAKSDFLGLIIFFTVAIILAFTGYILGYDLTTIIALLSILISVITISAMYIQNRHLSNQAESMQQQTGLAQSTTSYSLAFQMQSIFLEHPDLWPYFHGGKQIEKDCSPEKLSKIEIIGLVILDFYEVVLTMQKYNPLTQNEKTAWKDYFVNEFKKSLALRQTYKKYESSYKYILHDLYYQAEQELKK